MRRSDDERIALARWLMANAHRLSRYTPPRTASQMRTATEAQNDWHRARSSLWSAAATLRRMEGA